MSPFASPLGTALLPLFLLLLAAALLARLRNRRRAALWGGAENLSRLALAPAREWDTLRAAALWAALGLSFLAFARPQWGEVAETVQRTGLDVVLCLDVSRSMAVSDLPPTRLERARMEIRSFLSADEGDRTGLVAFAGVPLVLCPLTEDGPAVSLLLDLAETDLIPAQGTDVGKALEAAAALFGPARDRDAVVILFSDGEDMGNSAQEGARALARNRIRLFCVGVGTSAGGPVPGPTGGPVLDPDTGKAAVSRLDEKALRQMAGLADGRYWSLGSGGSVVPKILEELGRLKRREYASRSRATRQEQYRWFVLPALLFLLAALAIPGRVRAPAAGKSAATTAAALLLLLPSLSAGARSPASLSQEALEAFRQGSPGRALLLYRQALASAPNAAVAARLQYNIGTCLLAQKEFAPAADALTLALASPQREVKEAALYNLAHATYGMGSTERALSALRILLVEEPSHREAKVFYEWILQNRPEEPPPPPDQPKEPPPAAKPPDLLEQIPLPPPKDLQDQVRPPDNPPPGMKPW
ncbi:MAG: vWA domain-containing protein [Acidobacteriota bacterium]